MITRYIQKSIEEKLFKGKVITLLGARQTGKTTLLRLISKNHSKMIWLNADEYDIQEKFKNPTSTGLKALIGNAELVVIDEAQKILGIGLALKLLVDNFYELVVEHGEDVDHCRIRTDFYTFQHLACFLATCLLPLPRLEQLVFCLPNLKQRFSSVHLGSQSK